MINPARQLYLNMDIDKLQEDKEVASTGLLAPRKRTTDMDKSSVNQPAFRVAQQMKVLRKQRKFKDGI
tara:strand:- start:891 stop:1094 length:204 start_codon:yes stop_codon:yes gene_type:complete